MFLCVFSGVDVYAQVTTACAALVCASVCRTLADCWVCVWNLTVRWQQWQRQQQLRLTVPLALLKTLFDSC